MMSSLKIAGDDFSFIDESLNLCGSTNLYNVLLAGLVLGGPLHRAPPQVHGELGFGLAASELGGGRKQMKGGTVKTGTTCSLTNMQRVQSGESCFL